MSEAPRRKSRRKTSNERIAAEDALLDRTHIVLSPEAYAEFVARLDAPPKPNARLRKTMRKPLPWA